MRVWRIRGAHEHLLVEADARHVPVPAAAATLVFDPPFDAPVPFCPRGRNWESRLVFTNGMFLGAALALHGTEGLAWQFIWDCKGVYCRHGRPMQRHKSCLWYGDRGTYRWRGYRLPPRASDGHRPKLADIYYDQLTRIVHDAGHSHAKPVPWIACLLGNCAVPDRVVYDPYAGSGSTLLAGEEAGFAVIAVERDPDLTAAICARCQRAGLDVAPADPAVIRSAFGAASLP